MSEAATPAASHLEAGRAALARGDWAEARRRLDAAIAGAQTPEAHEGRAEAALAEFDMPAAIHSLERAHELWCGRGDARGMARTAILRGWAAMAAHGETAVCHGWLARARELLREVPESPEHGWLAVREAELLHRPRQDFAAARECTTRALSIARAHGDQALEMEALAQDGATLLRLGQVAEGMRALDLAASMATLGAVGGPVATGSVMCQVLCACEDAHDFERSSQWIQSLDRAQRSRPLPVLNALCRNHVAHLRIQRGEWGAAEDTLRPPTTATTYSGGQVWVQWGDLRLRQGRLDEAEAAYRRMPHLRGARLGLAGVVLERGDALGARDLIERCLRAVPETAALVRAPALALLVRAQLLLGDVDAAAAAASEIESTAELAGTLGLSSLARRAQGQVACARGEHDRARQAFEDAVDDATRAGLPFERAEAHLGLARALLALGRAAAAAREAGAAREGFAALGAQARADAAAELERQCSPEAACGEREALPLSERELEVLRLVADGLSNKEIAARLFLSEHTVKRHVANILTRLGLPSRAAAVAQAARFGRL